MEDDREKPAARPRGVPAMLAPLVCGRRWFRDRVGESGCAIWRLHRPGEPDLYLKRGRGAFAGDAADEGMRLRWLQGRVPAPSMLAHVAEEGVLWLLSTALPGRTAWQVIGDAPPADRPALAAALGTFLRGLHDLPVADCPFDSGHGRRLQQARERLAAGLIDEEDFDAEHEGWPAERVVAEMTALLPLPTDAAVVTHGDYSLDNILMAGGAVTGVIDLGRLGMADRYQDLAILWNGLREFGADAAEAALRAYGAWPPDERRMRFHLLLDECF